MRGRAFSSARLNRVERRPLPGVSLRNTACPALSRRDLLVLSTLGPSLQQTAADAAEQAAQASFPDYSVPGPLQPMRLPKLEHTCARCFPACQLNKCRLRLEIWYPKGGSAVGLAPPYPLAILSSGFLVSGDSYQSYAKILTSWGYTVILYDKVESALDTLDDVVSARFVTDLIDWAESDPLLRQVSDASSVYLVGHSRGGKIATLAACMDERVHAICLIDPVDNTIYAPLGPGFPSATQALRDLPSQRALPLAVVGGAIGSDCVPRNANYEQFYAAASSVAWEVVINDSGHFQFLDRQTMMQQAICAQGFAPDASVRRVAHAVMVAWGNAWVRYRGDNGASRLQPGMDESGRTVAGFATLPQVKSFFATSSRLEHMLETAGRDAFGNALTFQYKLKNISLL